MRLTLAFLCLATAAQAETRCGWIVNPTPGNWWLTDAQADWTIATQGAGGAPGMDLIPDLTAGEWVEVNGSYGYGCACLEVGTDGAGSILRILSVRQLPLARCENDPALPGP
jgi:hypothetical protein